MINFLRKIAPILFLAGLAVILGAVGLSYIALQISTAVKIAIAAGSLLLITAIFSVNYVQLIHRVDWKKDFLILFSLLMASGALLISNYYAHRLNRRFDWTTYQQHTLNSTTLDILNSLQSEIIITVLHVGFPPKYIEDLLAEYKRTSPLIKSEIIDPLEQLSYAAEFEQVITGKEKKVIVESRNERAEIDFQDQPLNEELLTNAIVRVSRDKRILYFLSGHGEYALDDEGSQGLSLFQNLLQQNNCEAKFLFLATKKKVPADCDLLVIAGPADPIPETEIEIIQDYLDEGGEALIFIETAPVSNEHNLLSEMERKKNPALNNLLNPWGLEIGDDVVVDLANHIGQDVGIPATNNYPPHRQIVHNLDYSFFVRPRSISLTEKRPENIKVAPLVLTASPEQSWAEKSKTLKVKFDPQVDTKGPIPLGAIIWEPKKESKKNKESDTRIIVFTDADFISNSFLGQYSNAALAVNSIGWLTQREDMIRIDSLIIDVPRLDITSKQKRVILVLLATMPLSLCCAGFLIWWQRNLSRKEKP